MTFTKITRNALVLVGCGGSGGGRGRGGGGGGGEGVDGGSGGGMAAVAVAVVILFPMMVIPNARGFAHAREASLEPLKAWKPLQRPALQGLEPAAGGLHNKFHKNEAFSKLGIRFSVVHYSLWGLHWGPPTYGNYHIVCPATQDTHQKSKKNTSQDMLQA